MLDFISSDKGWTLEYCNELSFWQVMTLWERYWTRRQLEIHIIVKTSPFGSSEPEKDPNTIDANSDDGWAKLATAGLPVKNLA